MWGLFVTVYGPMNRETGMVTDIAELDRLVQKKVIQLYNGQDLRKVLGIQRVTGEQLVRAIWDHLVKSVPSGRLERIRLVQTRDLVFEFSG